MAKEKKEKKEKKDKTKKPKLFKGFGDEALAQKEKVEAHEKKIAESAAKYKKPALMPGFSKASMIKYNNIASSEGTTRLNKILNQPTEYRVSYIPDLHNGNDRQREFNERYKPKSKEVKEEVKDPNNEAEVARYVSKVVVPELKVDTRSIGGSLKHKKNMTQETLVCMKCNDFHLNSEKDAIQTTALEHPDQYAKHKRSLGFGSGRKQLSQALKYVVLVRSTNRILIQSDANNTKSESKYSRQAQDDQDDDASEASYDRMFRSEELEDGEDGEKHKREFEEVSTFPMLVCMTLNPDGTNPDIRKLISLDQLTTVNNMTTGNVIQLVFAGDDSVKIDFAEEANAPSANMKKERFVWSILQIHIMLCTSVVERNSLGTRQNGSNPPNKVPALNVRNLDRGELQYIATVNGFLRDSPPLFALVDRQRDIAGGNHQQAHDGDARREEMEQMASDMIKGNFSTRYAIYKTAEERLDAEAVLNATNFNGDDDGATAASALSNKLQQKMRDLEAETCKRLIAWEDEKHHSMTGQKDHMVHSKDGMSLGLLFGTLDSLDTDLKIMEEWLFERAAHIRPLTDDCRDIEEENRQLEQQWNSYAELSKELKKLLTGVGIPKESERLLKNPASALTYDQGGQIDIEASEPGVDKIHHAGKALREAMENAKQTGGVHLRAVNERVEDLTAMSNTFCTNLAQIIVTVMEQIKSEVMIASDNGKVSKSDTHKEIAKKVRDVSVSSFVLLFC